MGVRNRKTRKTKVVKIIGRTVRTGHECHKARGVHENTMTGLLETSIPLDKAYAALGIASEGGMSKTKKALAVRGVPEGMQKPTIEAPPAAPKLPEHVSEVEYSFVESLIEKHGLDYNAMARDLKLNTYQHTPKQLRRKISKVVRVEKRLFPDSVYSELFGDGNTVGDLPSDDEW